MLPTGGVTEQFDREGHRDEGCTEADWVRVNFLLWQATNDTEYLDQAERTLRNHIYATQFTNGGFGHQHWRPLTQGDKAYPGARIMNVGTEAYWCCSMHGTQILADVADWAVLASDNRIVITWLGEVKSTVRVNDQDVTVTTQRIAPGKWSVRLETDEPTVVVLRCRVPKWSPGIIGQLGFIPNDLQLDAIEISGRTTVKDARRTIPGANNLPVITASDAHFLDDIGKVRSEFLLAEPELAEIRLALQGKNGRKVMA